MNIQCSHCRGTGKVTLKGPLLQCYEVVHKIGPATRESIHAATPKNGNALTATYQRVLRLERMGLVKRMGSGRGPSFQVV